jgi:hypothetical protein
MTSDSTFPSRLTEIDELTRSDHYYLTDSDKCYFIGEYTARQRGPYSAGNNLIMNFKKKMDRQGRAEWRYKGIAIQQAAEAFENLLDAKFLNTTTFVPIPPSRAKSDPLYDDRMTQMLKAIRPDRPLDVRELIIQSQTTDAAHDRQDRLRPEELEALYRVDRRLRSPAPSRLAICDDVLTTGCHFRAAQAVLQKTFPGVRTIGLFIVRRVPEAFEFPDLDDDE